MSEKRTIYLISDHTGITVETMGLALLSQFASLEYELVPWPFIDSLDKAQSVAREITRLSQKTTQPPIIFSTLVDPSIRDCFKQEGVLMLDFFATFTSHLEKELQLRSSPILGRHHSMINRHAYDERIHAVHFALANDDGCNTKNYPVADIILIGPSRSGKTPTCLYLGLQQGILAANYPLTDDDLMHDRLPSCLQDHHKKLYGLIIDAQQLHRIRWKRRPDSRYASLAQCKLEVRQSEALFLNEHIPFLDTTAMSIEELATRLKQWIEQTHSANG